MNKREIEILNPQETCRGKAFSLWMTSPMPMVTLVKTLDVTKIVKYAHSHKLSFNMLLCWCISFQFHHVQMDGGDGARFLEELQSIISSVDRLGYQHIHSYSKL